VSRSLVLCCVVLLLAGCPARVARRSFAAPLPVNPSQDYDGASEAPVALVAAPAAAVASVLHVERRSHWIWAKVTAYEPSSRCCGPDANGYTSTMVNTRRHPYGIAVDPRLISYGSKIRVPGYLEQSHPGEFWAADDTGGAMREDGEQGIVHLDVRFKSFAAAKAWGVRWMWVEILDDEA
jgi:3D (Asp-Asp-Asp) domain-containing protein